MAISDREIERDVTASTGARRDRVMVIAHQGGDAEAFSEIVRAYYPALLTHAFRCLQERSAAEDAVQESLLRAYRGLTSFNGDYHLRSWLYRILANVCIDEGNRRRREATAYERSAAQPEVGVTTVEELNESSAARREVAQAIAKLPKNYREALVLRDVLELEYADIAARAGITEENARARVHRARTALRRLVGSSRPGGILVGALYRIGRWTPRVARHLVNSTSAVPDMVNVPARASYAVTAVAATSAAAVAVVSAVPLVAGAFGSPPPRPPAAVVVRAYSTPSTAAVAATRPAAVAAPTIPSTSTSTTSTSTTLAVVGAPRLTTTVPSGPNVLAVLRSAGVPTDSGGGMTEEPAQLSVSSGSPITGRLTTQLTLPGARTSLCSGSLTARFVWSPPSAQAAGRPQVALIISFASQVTDPHAAIYQLTGFADVTGDPGFDGHDAVSGTLTVPSDGSDAELSLQLLAPSHAPTTAGCPAGPTTTTQPAPTSTTSTVVSTTTTAPGQ